MKKLKHSPLLETILELRWTTKEHVPESFDLGPNANEPFKADDYHKIFLLKMYDHLISNGYPEYSELPQAGVPEEYAANLVQHRFTQEESGWPMVQFGPGILTLNDTKSYDWLDYKERAINLAKTLYEIHPKKEKVKFTDIVLRYINSVPFNFEEGNLLDFLATNLKVNVGFDQEVIDHAGVTNSPRVFNFLTVLNSIEPVGQLYVTINRGLHEDQESIIWELMFRASVNSFPTNAQEFEVWIEGAHQVIDRWFKKSIEGELERRFGGYE
ncbi:TIGR04255 family protein [Paenibacillus donghaensis]|nr:TIGR04255 family protein [Paenibacillus donghaensis]